MLDLNPRMSTARCLAPAATGARSAGVAESGTEKTMGEKRNGMERTRGIGAREAISNDLSKSHYSSN